MEINPESIIQKKTLGLKSKKINYPLDSVKIHDLPNLGEVKFDENLKNSTTQWIEEASPKVTLFKTTLSRLLAVQVIYTILHDINEKEDNLMQFLDEENLKNLINNIIYVNDCEWNYFQINKIKFNFVFNLVQSFLNHHAQIIELFKKNHHKDSIFTTINLFNLAIPCTASAEFFIIKNKSGEENTDLLDHKKILICEYLLISEFFVQEEQIKFINAIIHKIFNEISH